MFRTLGFILKFTEAPFLFGETPGDLVRLFKELSPLKSWRDFHSERLVLKAWDIKGRDLGDVRAERAGFIHKKVGEMDCGARSGS